MVKNKDAATQNAYHDALRRARRGAWEMADALREIRERELYLVEFETFDLFCVAKFGIRARAAQHLIAASQSMRTIGSHMQNTENLPETPSQLRPLAGLEPEQQIKVWEKVAEDEEPPSRRRVQEVKDELYPKPQRAISKGVEAAVLDAAARTMGGIDTDPCTRNNLIAQNAYSPADGLTMPWGGNVFLFPPSPNRWVNKLLDEMQAGNVTQAVLILKHDPYGQYEPLLKDWPRADFVRRLVKDGTQMGEKFRVFFSVEDIDEAFGAFEAAGLIHSIHGLIAG